MKGNLIQSLTGLNRTQSHAILVELLGNDTMTLRQMQNGVAELNRDDAAVLLAAFENPVGKQQTAASENFKALRTFFFDLDGVPTDAAPAEIEEDPFAVVVSDAPWDAAEEDPFADSAPVSEVDPFADPAPAAPVDGIFAEPSVGADPIEYDRTALEKDAAPDKLEEADPVAESTTAHDAIFGGA